MSQDIDNKEERLKNIEEYYDRWKEVGDAIGIEENKNILQIATLFSGIGTPEQSLKHLCVEHETVFACEIDKYARTTYLANNETPNTFYDDVYNIDGNKYKNQIDILIGGSPCQSFSIAGKRMGTSCPRGNLIYEYFRIVEESKPKVFIYENVKGFLSIDKIDKKEKYGETFKNFVQSFKELGYTIYYEILNTKDYGVPQNRERIYIVGFRDEVEFEFAPKEELKLRLKDMLEDEVDEKYLLNQELVSKYLETGTASNYKGSQAGKVADENDVFHTVNAGSHGYSMGYVKLQQTHTLNIKGNDSIKRIYSSDGLCPSLTTMQGGHREPKVAIRNETIEIENDEVNKYKISETIKPSVAKNIQREMGDILKSQKDFYVCKTDAGWQDNKIGLKTSPTLRANNSSIYGLDRANYIFRKLTPRECFRLQGFDDNFIFPPKMSDTQLYKQAGNGMSRNILDMIFTQIFKSKNFDLSSNS